MVIFIVSLSASNRHSYSAFHLKKNRVRESHYLANLLYLLADHCREVNKVAMLPLLTSRQWSASKKSKFEPTSFEWRIGWLIEEEVKKTHFQLPCSGLARQFEQYTLQHNLLIQDSFIVCISSIFNRKLEVSMTYPTTKLSAVSVCRSRLLKCSPCNRQFLSIIN